MSVVAKLSVQGIELDILNVNYAWHRMMGFMGQPSSSPFGGEIDLVIESNENDDFFYQWLLEEDEDGYPFMLDGKVLFYRNDGGGKMFEYDFADCYCTAVGEEFSNIGDSSMLLKLRLSPAIQKIRNAELKKVWMRSGLEPAVADIIEVVDQDQSEGVGPEPQLLDCYYTDEDGTVISGKGVEHEDKIYFVIKTSNAVGEVVNIEFGSIGNELMYQDRLIGEEPLGITICEDSQKLLMVVNSAEI